MTLHRRHVLALAGLSALGGCATAPAAVESPLGWGGVGKTIGGAGARPEHVFDERDRAGLDAALRLGDKPKIIRIHAFIDLCPGGVEAFRDPEFSFDAFDRAFDPATWGRDDPKGPLEDARKRSEQRQAAVSIVRLPSNPTLNLSIRGASGGGAYSCSAASAPSTTSGQSRIPVSTPIDGELA